MALPFFAARFVLMREAEEISFCNPSNQSEGRSRFQLCQITSKVIFHIGMGSTTGGEEENPFDEATLSSAQKLIKSIRRQEHSRLITFRALA